MFAFDQTGNFSGKLPKEFYLSIHSELVKCTGSNKVRQILEALDAFIFKLFSVDDEPHTDMDIIDYMKQTRTRDNDYDSEEEMPFFSN